MASEITEKEFGDYFSQYGIVKDAVVMVDRNTGSSRGFGLVPVFFNLLNGLVYGHLVLTFYLMIFLSVS